MSTPISKPVVPAQPSTPFYPTSSLALFQTYTRDTYRTAFGIEAAPWDPTRVTKSWFDSTVDASDAGNVAIYKILGRDTTGNPVLKQMVMPATEAATVNLAGSILYPAYIVPPTDATRGGQPMNASYLSMQADATRLMAALGGASLQDQATDGTTGVFPIVYPADEPRRMWYFQFKNQPQYVGLLLLTMNAHGVGAPGSWDLTGSQPVWAPSVPAPTGVGDTRPTRDMPLRDLLPNEALQAGLMGIDIARTDLQQAAQQASGEFTADDRAALQLILQKVTKLAG